ncbi:CTNA1 protein, partial [Rostratula benghalensis]|nr:CTNA1 protein [Rostratula benghalensis]
IQAASWLLECLSVLRDAGDMPGLLAAFRAFSEALLLLSNLTAKRLEELGDCPQQKSLAQTLQLLQKCIPFLHTAKHSDLKHSCDQQVNLSKDYTFQLMERTIRELTSLLVSSTGRKEPWDRNGTFSQQVSRLLAFLSCPDPVQLSDSEVSAHVEAIVFYCMLLADSSRSDLKLDLVKHCCVLLQLRKSICSHINQQKGCSGQSQGESSLEKEWYAMREEVEALHQTVLTATLCQILDTFFEGKEPLRQLVEDALSLVGTGCFPADQGAFLKKLQPLTATFFTHAQQMLRVADFVLARCTKTQTAREIGEWVEYLKRLLASLPPLLTAMSRNTAQMRAAEQLQSLYRTWAGTTESLLQCFEETVSMSQFLKLSVQEMAKHREWCEKALESQDPERLSWHATRLIRWAQWVVEATTRYVERATDPIFRNGLLVWVEQLASSILELKTGAALCSESLYCLQTRDAFSKAVSCLMDSAHHVRDGLNGSNHPDILSPLREEVRSADEALDDKAKAPDLHPPSAGLKAILGEHILSHPPPQAGNLHLKVIPRKGALHPVITALLAATRAHDMAAVSGACSALLDLSDASIDAAKEALPVAESPHMGTLGQYQKIVLLTPRVISLARETASRQLPCPGRLLQMALTLSERICMTKECLAAMSGPWYSLSQQVLGFILSADFLSGKQALSETMMGLAGVVHLAEDIVSVARSTGNPAFPHVWESFLQVQAKFSRAQMTNKVLLERAASSKSSCRVRKASLELRCVQWAISMHVVLSFVDQFIGRDALFLRELRSAMNNKLCPQNLLAAVSENSLRLQEAARLSYLSCPEDCGRSEILVLREEIKVLVEALLDASSILSVSPVSSASLYIRFELLQRDLALRAKALLLHLEKVNTKQLQVIRDVVGPALSPPCPEDMKSRREAFEEKACQLMANVQWVKTTLQDTLESSAQLEAQANLLSIAEHLLVLTSDAVGSASQLFESSQDKGHLHLDSVVWYWSAKAHYFVTQLQAVQGINEHILQLMRQHLQNAGDQCSLRQSNSTARLFPAREPDAQSHAKSAETCPSRSRQGSGAGTAHEMVQ